ncbi:hypothetical protein SCHIN_v1c00880 [Spiroplasma chinense]|uniref:Uncharacterized protein n=1 Tax=Spiroplasma chinense TaxID=216932 RepID=A0A5B9Y3N4_9MOLU|nr:hypothetical protein SCHIN_v1c00880 [Spiroplasma chinense]
MKIIYNNNFLPIFKLNAKRTFLNKQNCIWLASFYMFYAIMLLLFFSLGSLDKSNENFWKLLSFENIFSYIFISLYSGFIMIKLYFSSEAKSYLQIEKQYGFKIWKTFVVRFSLFFCYMFIFISIKFLLSFILTLKYDLSFIVLYFSLPNFNYLLIILFIFSIAFITLFLFNQLLGPLVYASIAVLLSVGPIISSAMKTEIDLMNVNSVNTLLFNAQIGKDFYDAIKKDGLTLYSGEQNQQLFKMDEDSEFYYSYFEEFLDTEPAENFIRISIEEDLYKPYTLGQALNKNSINGEDKYVMGFDKSFLDMFFSLQDSVKDLNVSTEKAKQLPYKEIVEYLKKQEFGEKYKHLLSFVQEHNETIRGYVYDEMFNQDEYDENNSYKKFYMDNPSFLIISHTLIFGFKNSFALDSRFFRFTLKDETTRRMSVSDYFDIIKESRKRQILNYFNFNKYLQFQYTNQIKNGEYLYLVYGFWDSEIIEYFQISQDAMNKGADNEPLDTRSSIYSKDFETKKTYILVYVYSIYLIKIILGLVISFILFKKKSFRD